MITGIWVRPEDPEENDLIVIEYAEDDDSWAMLIDGNGDALPSEGAVPASWTRIFPVSGVHNSIAGSVTGAVVQGRDMGPVTFS